MASPASRDKGRGTKYEGRLDPLDPLAQLRARQQGLELFATVLEPGQTILAPQGWWHYAVSLTPTLTLMCNFYDLANVKGLQESFVEGVAKAFDGSKREQRAKALAGGTPPPALAASHPVVAASAEAPFVAFASAVSYRAVHAPWVYVRAEPDTQAELLGILHPGHHAAMGGTRGGWLRTAEPFARGRHGWALLDGTPLGLKALMTRDDNQP